MHVGGRGVARLAAVNHQHRTSRTSKRQCAAQTGGSAADYYYVVPLPLARRRYLSAGPTCIDCCHFYSGHCFILMLSYRQWRPLPRLACLTSSWVVVRVHDIVYSQSNLVEAITSSVSPVVVQ